VGAVSGANPTGGGNRIPHTITNPFNPE